MNDTSTLQQAVGDWWPEPITETDRLDPGPANRLAATLDYDETFTAAAELPAPWHWLYFPGWPPTAELGEDGHPAAGHFLPPLPHRRRMFAGSTMRVHVPLRLGVETERLSRLDDISYKSGRSGEMMFVSIATEYRQDSVLAVSETQTLVYRSEAGDPRRIEREIVPLTEATSHYSVEPKLTAAHLFRYSALTSNAHRIHYDEPYAREVEGYPALVVHGPLLATYMADLARRHGGGSPLAEYTFRLQRPVFLGDAFRVEVDTDEAGGFTCRVVTGDGVVHAVGSGFYR